MPRCRVVNAKPNIQELHRIRRDIGARLGTEYAVAEPAPQSLVAVRKELETRDRNAELEKRFAEVDERVAELLHAVGREFRNRCDLDGDAASVTDAASEVRPGQVRGPRTDHQRTAGHRHTSLNGIAVALNGRGVPTPAGSRRRHATQVARVPKRLAG
jgi:hypothetical protein